MNILDTSIADRLRRKRIELGFTDSQIADAVGLSTMEYYDIESYPDELETVVELGKVKRLLGILGIDLLDACKIQCAFCGNPSKYREDYAIPRNELVHRARQTLGLSERELGDRLGFEETAIYGMEHDPDFLESWPVSCIEELSRAIDIPLQVLMDIKCKYCGN